MVERAIAEAQVAFDPYPGGKRNHDLLIKGTVASGPIVIDLEAKADETYGETVAQYQARATAPRPANKPTNADMRLAGLLAEPLTNTRSRSLATH